METIEHLVVGAGIYGLTAALELCRRGHVVQVIDPGPIPHPDAASTDISKVVRMEYGSDSEYMALVDAAIDGWHAWNEELPETLYHETGITMLTRSPMAAGGFEYESFHHLLARGHTPERLDGTAIAERFPAWKAGEWVDGFFHARAGYVESGRVVAALAERARGEGVVIDEGQTATRLVRERGRVVSVVTAEGRSYSPDQVVVCAGAWTPHLVPELSPVMKATGHPVFHLRAPRPERFSPPGFVVFTADIARGGWYGFPQHPHERVVKIANHGVGVGVDPQRDERRVSASHHAALEEFLAGAFADLVGAEVVATRLCLYCDTLDEHLWIDRHPEVANLTVAAGGSGHAFKMAPLLGELIAGAVEGREDHRRRRFGWRRLDPAVAGREEARHHGEKS